MRGGESHSLCSSNLGINAKPETPDAMSTVGSRRNSYYAGGYEQNNRYQSGGPGGYYGSRQSLAQRESWADGGFPAGPGPRSRFHRTQYQSGQYDSGWNPRQSNAHSVYPTPGYQQSRDTVITGGSDSNHSAGPYSTDPSSDSSSVERGGPVGGPVQKPGPDLGEQYGFSGFGGNNQPIHEELGNYNYRGGPSNNGYYSQGQHEMGHVAPPVPMKTMGQQMPNNPNMIKLSSNGQGGAPAVGGGGRPNTLTRKGTDVSEKRKSWFKRRFSKD